VTPGRYTLTATTSSSGRSAATPARTFWAVADVDVNGVDVDLQLELQPGMTVSGHVIFSGASPPPANLSVLRFVLAPQNAGANLSGSPSGGDVDAAGKFAFAGVISGRYRPTYIVTNSAAMGPWGLQSVTARQRELLDTPLEVRPGDDVELVATFTDRPAQLTGKLETAAGTPATDYFIILFSTDKSAWRPASRRVRMVRPATDGRFAATLPAGDYWIAALTDVRTNEWFDAAFLAQLPANVKVTLVDGQTTTQDLKIGAGSAGSSGTP
jgi:hypothetical protein